MLQFPIAHVSEKPDLSNTDMLCLIGEIRDGDCLPELLSYVKNLRAKEVKMAAIITCAANTDDSQIMLRKLLEQKNILVNGENICLSRSLFLNIGHPNKSDFVRSANYIKGILGLPKYD